MGRQIIARAIRRLAFRAIRASDVLEYPGYQPVTVRRLRAARRRWARGVYYVPGLYLANGPIPENGLIEIPGRFAPGYGL